MRHSEYFGAESSFVLHNLLQILTENQILSFGPDTYECERYIILTTLQKEQKEVESWEAVVLFYLRFVMSRHHPKRREVQRMEGPST